MKYGRIVIESKEELFEYVSSEQIFTYYFGNFEPDHWYSSPLPDRNETLASFTISFYNDEWVYRDFGISKYPNDCITFVQNMHPLEHLTFNTALNKIYKDMVEGNEGFITIPKKEPTVKKKDVGLRLYDFEDWHLEFWKQGNISHQQLLDYKIRVGEVWNNGKIYMYNKRRVNNPVFVYLFDIQKKIWKAYQPNAWKKSQKFFSNNISDHIQGWDLMESKYLGSSYDTCIITKSYKDVIVLDQLDIPAIAPHSESMFLAPWEVTALKGYFKYIYVLYDNDDTGVKNCKKFTEQYGLNYVNVPLGLDTITKPTKDPWDVVVNYSYDMLNTIIDDKFIRDGI